LVERAAQLGRRLLDGLRVLAPLPAVGDVRGLGLMAAVELVADKATRQPFPPEANVGPRVANELLKRGLFTRMVGETICLAPPLVTMPEQIDRIVEIIGEAVHTVREA
jgi:putrescine---pyruvate transaminase